MPLNHPITLAILLTLISPIPTRAQAPGELYAPWNPGDAGVYVNEQSQVYGVCMSRDYKKDCENDPYPYLGKWDRVSDSVIQSRDGTYFCKHNILQQAKYHGRANCSKGGWVKSECENAWWSANDSDICPIGKFGPL